MVRGNLIFFAVTFLIVVLIFGGLIFMSLKEIQTAEVPEPVRLGKKVWQEKACIECHTVLGNGGYYGPDLTEVFSKRGEDWLREYFRDPPVLPTAKKKRHVSLGESEIEMITRYLSFMDWIKRVDNWPPKPIPLTPKSR